MKRQTQEVTLSPEMIDTLYQCVKRVIEDEELCGHTVHPMLKEAQSLMYELHCARIIKEIK